MVVTIALIAARNMALFNRRRAALQARNIRPQARLGVVIADRAQCVRAIDDAIHPHDQHRDESRDGAEQQSSSRRLSRAIGDSPENRPVFSLRSCGQRYHRNDHAPIAPEQIHPG
jgi:hypothetical protein